MGKIIPAVPPGPQTAQCMGQKEDVLVPLFDAQRALGVAPRSGERRIFQNVVELDFVPLVLAAADGIALHHGATVEAVEHRVHGGHAQDILIAVETVKGPGLQKIPLSAAQLFADADLADCAVGRDLFVDEFRAGVGQQHVLVGGDEKTAGAAGRVADGAADPGIDHLGQHPDQVARGAELGRLLLSAQLAGQVLKEVALDIGIHA